MSFDRVARHYRWLEAITFGNALQRARTSWIDKIPSPPRALIVGEGNGRFLCELLRVHPNIDIDCMDVSAQMLRLARERVSREQPHSLNRIRFLNEDVRSAQLPEQSYDLVVTHFFLDCFRCEEAKQVVGKLSAAATERAVWLLADFAIPQKTLARLHAKFWLEAMYLFFRTVGGIEARQLVDPTPFLEANGFACTGRRLSRHGLVKSELWQRS